MRVLALNNCNDFMLISLCLKYSGAFMKCFQ